MSYSMTSQEFYYVKLLLLGEFYTNIICRAAHDTETQLELILKQTRFYIHERFLWKNRNALGESGLVTKVHYIASIAYEVAVISPMVMSLQIVLCATRFRVWSGYHIIWHHVLAVIYLEICFSCSFPSDTSPTHCRTRHWGVFDLRFLKSRTRGTEWTRRIDLIVLRMVYSQQ